MMIVQKKRRKRRLCWKRVCAILILIVECIAVIGIFFAMRKDGENQLLAVKQQVVETEKLASSPEDIYVFRLKGSEYIYVLDDRNVSINSQEIQKKIDSYIDFQMYRACAMVIGIVLTLIVDFSIVYNLID